METHRRLDNGSTSVSLPARDTCSWMMRDGTKEQREKHGSIRFPIAEFNATPQYGCVIERKAGERFSCSLRFERKLYKQGLQRIAGIDEAGRGPLAGPVIAAAVMLPPNFRLRGLNDSKQLSCLARE